MHNITYQLDCPKYPGLAKTIEEYGELGQVFGKIMSCGGNPIYPWGNVDLAAKLDEEISDLMACLIFLSLKCEYVNSEYVAERTARKMKLFEAWADGRTETSYDDIVL